MLAPMRFKTFTFPHNPRTYSITCERLTAVQKVPMGAYTMQDLGRTCRVLRGEGEFYGPDAYDTFRRLATLFYEPGPGLLCHPVWQSSRAYFTGLSLTQEPREDYVAYAFTFREGYFGYAGMKEVTASAAKIPSGSTAKTAAVYVTVKTGDTLWAIANSRGMTLQALLKLNPGIANPNLVRVGQKVRVS